MHRGGSRGGKGRLDGLLQGRIEEHGRPRQHVEGLAAGDGVERAEAHALGGVDELPEVGGAIEQLPRLACDGHVREAAGGALEARRRRDRAVREQAIEGCGELQAIHAPKADEAPALAGKQAQARHAADRGHGRMARRDVGPRDHVEGHVARIQEGIEDRGELVAGDGGVAAELALADAAQDAAIGEQAREGGPGAAFR
ncbi:hypothetical protein D3C86_1453430 [compost metagenome]